VSRDARILVARDRGKSVTDIAQSEGVSRQAVYDALRRSGIVMQPVRARDRPELAQTSKFDGLRWCAQCDRRKSFDQAKVCAAKFCKVWEDAK
jgi:transposase